MFLCVRRQGSHYLALIFAHLLQVASAQLHLSTWLRSHSHGDLPHTNPTTDMHRHAQRMQWAQYARGFLLQVLQVGLQNAVGSCSGLQVCLNLCQLLGGRGERRSW